MSLKAVEAVDSAVAIVDPLDQSLLHLVGDDARGRRQFVETAIADFEFATF